MNSAPISVAHLCAKHLLGTALYQELQRLSMCLECGCGDVQNNHGRDDVTTAVIVKPDQMALPSN